MDSVIAVSHKNEHSELKSTNNSVKNVISDNGLKIYIDSVNRNIEKVGGTWVKSIKLFVNY